MAYIDFDKCANSPLSDLRTLCEGFGSLVVPLLYMFKERILTLVLWNPFKFKAPLGRRRGIKIQVLISFDYTGYITPKRIHLRPNLNLILIKNLSVQVLNLHASDVVQIMC